MGMKRSSFLLGGRKENKRWSGRHTNTCNNISLCGFAVSMDGLLRDEEYETV